MDKIYFIAGKGGSGKDTIANEMSRRLGLPVLPVHTTRKQEGHDENSIFETVETMFSRDLETREVRRYEHVSEHVYYGTFKEDAKDGQDYIAVGPSEMYLNFLALFKERVIVPIVLDASRDTRLKRMKTRDKAEAMRRVMADDREWLNIFGYAITVNADMSFIQVADTVEHIIKREMESAVDRI